MRRPSYPCLAVFVVAAVCMADSADAQNRGRRALDPQALERLVAEAGSEDQVSVNPATGATRFVRLKSHLRRGLGRRAAAPTVQEKHAQSMSFFRDYATTYGVNPDAALQPVATQTDRIGGTHLTYRQVHRGVPVFGGLVRAHFDNAGELAAVSGTTVPDIAVSTDPSISAEAAGGAALATVLKGNPSSALSVRGTQLYVYRTGLAQGVEGENHLAWQVEVGDGESVREILFIDAHSAAQLDRFNAIMDAKHRRAYNTIERFPVTPFWVEGAAFPTPDGEANNVIRFAGETYDFYKNAFGRDSFDGAGGTMETVFRRIQTCPNASWNGIFTSYCAGVTPDDIVGHEWTHAYTQYTHALIYAWQPGALNEAYSDMFGEVIDLLNGTGRDLPGDSRSVGVCSAFYPFLAQLRVNSPASIAGNYVAGKALFGPPLTSAGLTGDLVLVDDGSTVGVPPVPGTLSDGCQSPFVNAAQVVGKVAVVDRGTCGFAVKVKNAQLNGAIGVVVANNGAAFGNMGGADPTITIPSLMVQQGDGNTIKAQLAAGVNATLRLDAPAVTESSYRWLMGEDSSSFGGAIRDMWDPTCARDPGKVSDAEYVCSESDNGGVHSNSGVPNHGFALLADGGTFNGHTVAGLGLTKVAHLYFRAMTVYQVPTSDFSDHADALEASCTDLIGMPLKAFDGTDSGQTFTAADCAQVTAMAAAVELRTPPAQCNFQPMLAKTPPDTCEVGTSQVNIFRDNFETAPSGWTMSHEAVTPASFTARDWVWANTLPARDGSALFAIDPNIGTCAADGDESGVLHADSPAVMLASGVASPKLTFDHFVATEPGWDGGNLKITVDGGATWKPVAKADFTYNPYNANLQTVAAGNTNPMAGQAAFTGADGGSVEGSWGRSDVNLAPYVAPNETFKLRFDLGTDGCSGNVGWFVDDVNVYTCTSNTRPTLTINDVAVVEGNTGTTDAVFTVSLSHAFRFPVVVQYRVKHGTAREDTDYIVAAGPVDDDNEGDDDTRFLVIPPLSISAQITVQVNGDTRREANETFFIELRRSLFATIADDFGMATIVNDDGVWPTLTTGSGQRH
jgi:Zn-dependent metalloprotease